MDKYIGKSKEELEQIKTEAQARNKTRYNNNTDWDDCFVSSQMDSAIVDVCKMLLNPSKKIIGKKVIINGYNVEVLGSREYKIVKDDIVNVVVNCATCKGKGARKYINDIDDIYNYLGTKEGRALLNQE